MTAAAYPRSSEDDWQAAREVWDQVRTLMVALRDSADEMERDLLRFEAKFATRPAVTA